MSTVYIEKPSPEEVTFDLAASLQKIGFVASAGLVNRSLEERRQFFNPGNLAHIASTQTFYREYAEDEGLYIATARRIGREEAVGFALVKKAALETSDNTIQTQLHIEEFTILPCDTVPIHEVGEQLVLAIQDCAEHEITASILAENLFVLHALKSQGFTYNIRAFPEIMENYFGEGSRPAVQQQLILPVSKSLAVA